MLVQTGPPDGSLPWFAPPALWLTPAVPASALSCLPRSGNPATWMLDVTTPAVEAAVGEDFADLYSLHELSEGDSRRCPAARAAQPQLCSRTSSQHHAAAVLIMLCSSSYCRSLLLPDRQRQDDCRHRGAGGGRGGPGHPGAGLRLGPRAGKPGTLPRAVCSAQSAVQPSQTSLKIAYMPPSVVPQLKELLRRNFQQYWRLMSYNGVRMAITSEGCWAGLESELSPRSAFAGCARCARCARQRRPAAACCLLLHSPPGAGRNRPALLPCPSPVIIAFFFGTVLHKQGENTYTYNG